MLSKTIFYTCMAILCLKSQLEATPVKFNMLKLINHMYGLGNETVTEMPELDWDTIDYREVTLKTNELEMSSKQLYEQVEECVKICMKNRKQSHRRDNCIAKHCDIY